MEKICSKHGLTEYRIDKRKGRKVDNASCKKCSSVHVSEQRRKLRRELVAEAGGKCVRCGYDKSIWALHFDHLRDKVAPVSVLIRTGRRIKAREEAKKCQLVCANCHAEVTEERSLLGRLAESGNASDC